MTGKNSLDVVAIRRYRCRKMAGNDTLNVPVPGHTVDPAPGGARDFAKHQRLRDREADELVAQLWETFGVPQRGGLEEADEQRHSLPS